MYGIVHYENETGEFHTVPCESEAEYEKELAVGCRWIEDEPRRFLNLWGERIAVQSGDVA